MHLVDLRAKRARHAIRSLRQYVRDARPDVVIAIAFEQDVAAALALLGMARRPLLFLTVHAPICWYLGLRRGFSRRLSSLLFRGLFRTADRVIAVSAGIAREIDRLGWSRQPAEVIHNPVLPVDFLELAQEPVLHDWLVQKCVPVIVAVGRLSEVKNYPLMIEAFGLLRCSMDARLMIVGDGECRGDIEALIARSGHDQSIALVGQVGNPFPYMRDADLLVLSSNFEGFGNVLVEAMAVGTPVVSSDCPFGPREILEDGKWGRLVPAGDAAALAKAMREELTAPRGKGVTRAAEFTAAAKAEEYSRLAGSLINQAPKDQRNEEGRH